MNAKERVMAVINHQKPDRMPCFGANSTVTYEQMEKVGAYWPEGHVEAEAMAKQALAAYTVLGFDAVRVPFCQTFEAVALDCIRKPGKVRELEGFPGIEHPPPYKLDDTPEFPDDFLSRGYIPELLKAVEILKKEVGDEVPIVAGIIGPFTIAGALVDTVPLLKATFKTPEKMRPFLDMAEKAGTALAKALIDAGADIISCEDMTASPELIIPKTYASYKLAREKCGPDVILMGGVDTATTLFMKDADTVRQGCEESIADGIQILAPGCAVAPGTPTENLLAMVEVAKAH
jgi:[methyl-Co(III) methanol-specific corrinoid protein]:coenzyme M methyltransferase